MSNIVRCPLCDKTVLFGQPHRCVNNNVLAATRPLPMKVIFESNPGTPPDPRPPVTDRSEQ